TMWPALAPPAGVGGAVAPHALSSAATAAAEAAAHTVGSSGRRLGGQLSMLERCSPVCLVMTGPLVRGMACCDQKYGRAVGSHQEEDPRDRPRFGMVNRGCGQLAVSRPGPGPGVTGRAR